MDIVKSKNARLKGSLTAVLNLITDSAPTKPRDKASDALTTATKEATLIQTTNKVFPKETLDEKVRLNFK